MNGKLQPRRQGFKAIFMETLSEMARRPVYWIGMFVLPLFMSVLFGTLMNDGLPTRIPAAIVDLDHSDMSRDLTQNIAGMQMVDLKDAEESFTSARESMQEGNIFGFFLIPENFQQDLLAGRKPVISFYTNYTFYIPATLLFKTFKTTAVYTKAETVQMVFSTAGVNGGSGVLLPVSISARGLNNPELNYSIYLTNSFLPCLFQLMIMMMTAYSLGEEIKYGRSRRLLHQAGNSVLKAVFTRLLPQTLIWMVELFFMVSLLYKWCHFPMNGSWGWLLLSEFLFVLASQGFALFLFCMVPNLRLALSSCALTGILSFSLGAFSFPYESMYGGIAVFSWILPTRYNFLIYIDQALNGIDIYYSRWWYIAYIIFIMLPLPLMGRLKKYMAKPVYVP